MGIYKHKISGTLFLLPSLHILSLFETLNTNNTLLSNLCSTFYHEVAYVRLKTKENVKISVQKVVPVTYERWSLTRGSKYSYLTGKVSAFWKTGRWGEVVAYETLSQMQVRLYLSGRERHCESKDSFSRTPHSHNYSSQGLNQDCEQAHLWVTYASGKERSNPCQRGGVWWRGTKNVSLP